MSTEHRQIDNKALARLYQQLGDPELPAWLDADVLVAHAAGNLSPALARRVQRLIDASPALAAIHQSLVDLAPHAEVLAQALAVQTQPAAHRQVRHAAPRHAVRRAGHHRRARWMGAAAAVLVAVAGVWGWQHFDLRQQAATASVQPAATVNKPDTIFDSSMDGQRLASNPAEIRGDSIFRADFKHKSS